MTDLTEAMHRATDALPPAGIDLDSIIHDHYRRVRRHRRFALAGGALAVTAALVAGPLLASGPAGTPLLGPNGPASGGVSTDIPRFTPSPVVAAHLTAVFRPALLAALPAGASVSPLPKFAFNPADGGYDAFFTVTDGHGRRTSITASVELSWPAPGLSCHLNDPPRIYCTVTSRPDGSLMYGLHSNSDATDGKATRSSERVWPNYDGRPSTTVMLLEQTAGHTFDLLPFAPDTLDALVSDPNLHITP